jgi:hypothetical protein
MNKKMSAMAISGILYAQHDAIEYKSFTIPICQKWRREVRKSLTLCLGAQKLFIKLN